MLAIATGLSVVGLLLRLMVRAPSSAETEERTVALPPPRFTTVQAPAPPATRVAQATSRPTVAAAFVGKADAGVAALVAGDAGPDGKGLSRTETDKLEEYVRSMGAKGLARAKVADDGTYLEQRLRSIEDRLDLVTEVRGKGLLWALGLSREVAADAVTRCLERGLIVNNVRPDAVRLCPPLIVSRDELDEGLAVLEGVLAELAGGPTK